MCKTDSDLKTRSYVKDGIFATSRYIMLQPRASEYEQNQEKKKVIKKDHLMGQRWLSLKVKLKNMSGYLCQLYPNSVTKEGFKIDSKGLF